MYDSEVESAKPFALSPCIDGNLVKETRSPAWNRVRYRI